jgi:phosphatidylglycerophosphatase A
MPVAPGTFGNLWGLPIAYALSGLTLGPQVLVLSGMILAAVFLAGRCEKILGEKDPSLVVVDEIVGYCTTLVGLPFSWKLAVIGFFVFRFLDIVKPFPVRSMERRLPGGWGVVMDDVLAGVYGQVLLRLWVYWLPK